MHRKGSTHPAGDRFAKVHGDNAAFDPTPIFRMFPDVPEVVLWGAEACERAHRQALAMEISPGYVDVIVERWEKVSGKKAVRQTP